MESHLTFEDCPSERHIPKQKDLEEKETMQEDNYIHKTRINNNGMLLKKKRGNDHRIKGAFGNENIVTV